MRRKGVAHQPASSISDQQFFKSAALQRQLENIAAAQTQRYTKRGAVPIKVQILFSESLQSVAYTDNRTIYINADHPMVKDGDADRQTRYERVCGLFTHELGHALYTDFPANKEYVRTLTLEQRFYPVTPAQLSAEDSDKAERMLRFIKEGSHQVRKAIGEIAHQIANFLEDGYIEARMLYSYPGSLGLYLSKLRALDYAQMPTVFTLLEMEKNGRPPLATLLQMVLTYSKYGAIKYGGVAMDNERIQEFYKLIDIVDAYVTTHDGVTRLVYVSLLLIRLWDYIQPQIEREELMAKLLKELESLTGVSKRGDSNRRPVATGRGSHKDAPTSLPNSESRTATHADAASSAKPGEKQTGPSAVSGPTPGSAEKDAGAMTKEPATGGGTLAQGNGAELSAGSVLGAGYTPYDKQAIAEIARKTVQDIAHLFGETVEEVAEQQFADKLRQDLLDANLGDLPGDIHRRIHREATVPRELVEAYNQVAPELVRISKTLQRSIKNVLKERKIGSKRTGLLAGPRLNAHALYRNDGEVFYKKNHPMDTPQLAVCLLVDQSGSMLGDGRYIYATAAAVILHDFCRELEIPVMVYGHNVRHEGFDLYSYAEFNHPHRDDKYRIMGIQPNGINHDGAALRYCCEKLALQPERTKLMIIVSDGMPNGGKGYQGEVAYADLRAVKKEYQRRGIIFAAAAIGSDLDTIKSIYGDSFLDITDLKRLPVGLTSLVKRHIR